MNEKKDRLDFLIKRIYEKKKKQTHGPGACPDHELLVSYLNGRSDEEERSRIEGHVSICRECSDTLISLAESVRSYSPTKETFTTANMVRKAKALINPQEKEVPIETKIASWFSSFKIKPAMALASVALAVFIVSVIMLLRPSLELVPAQFNILARIPPEGVARGKSDDYKEIEVHDGGVLRSGDLFKIQFTLQEDAYVYLLSLDSLGNLNLLFPDQSTRPPRKFAAQKSHDFPEKDKWWELDDNPGQETVYLILSRDPIDQFGKKFQELRKSGINRIKEIFPNAGIRSIRFEHK